LPAGVTVALLTNLSNANAVRETAEIQAAARQLGVRLVTFNTTTPDDIEAAFRSFAAQKIGGLMTANEPLFYINRDHVIALAARRGFPAIYSDRFFVEAGGLMSYGPRVPRRFAWPVSTPVGFSAARSPPTCRCSNTRRLS
jgi:putative tryptophan/tyrosine transport system substrate-binding protein